MQQSLQRALDPPTPLDMVADRFGNIIQCYSVLPPHQRPVITATSVVATSGTTINGAPLTPMERHHSSIASPYVPYTAALLASLALPDPPGPRVLRGRAGEVTVP